MLLSLHRQHRHRFDFEQHAIERQAWHRNQGAGRLWPVAECERQLLAEHKQPLFVVIDDEHGQLRDIRKPCAGGSQSRAEIAQRLTHLQAEVRRQRAVLGLATLPRHID